jgi:hypothetical protein
VFRGIREKEKRKALKVSFREYRNLRDKPRKRKDTRVLKGIGQRG